MHKRTFLKLASLMATGSLFRPPFLYRQDIEIGSNWAGNYHYKARNLHTPDDISKVQELVRESRKVHILGSRHSFNSIADSPEDLISLNGIKQEINLDSENRTVTVSAGIKYGDLAKYLHENGFALHNLASLPHISVAGACATATHGSGINNGNLSTSVSGLEILTASGDLVTLNREEDEQFFGAVVSLGGLGVVTKVKLDIQPTFEVRQDVYRNLSMNHLEDHFEDIMLMGYSVSFFTDYRDMNINQVWIKNRLDEGSSFDGKSGLFDAVPADRHMHPIEDISAENCTPQLGIPGPWHERLPHFRMDFTPSSGDELQAEYFVPLEYACEAVREIFSMSDQISPHLLISEIRTIAEDNLWMSTAYSQPSVAIHFTWKPDWKSVRNVLPDIEERLAPFDVRPHWGKLFTVSPEVLQSRCERIDDFRQLLRKYDPDGKFRNEFIDKYIF